MGIPEPEAATRGGRVAYLPLDEVGPGADAGRTDGFNKILAGPRPVLRSVGGGQIPGATIVAERAGEMIAEIALAMHTGMFAGRLAQATHAYPTWSSGVQLTAAQLVVEIGGRKLVRPRLSRARRRPTSLYDAAACRSTSVGSRGQWSSIQM